jgi:hypothetical protein
LASGGRVLQKAMENLVERPRRLSLLERETFAVRPDGRSLPFQTKMRRFWRVQDIKSSSYKLTLFNTPLPHFPFISSL